MEDKEFKSREVTQDEKKKSKAFFRKLGFAVIAVILGFLTVLVVNY